MLRGEGLMALIVTCPHCRRMESWKPEEGARTHCRFCKQPLTEGAQVTTAPITHQRRPMIGPDLRVTWWAGVAGSAIGLVISLVYHGVPIAVAAALLLADKAPEGQELTLIDYLIAQAVNFSVVAAVGFAVGAIVMLITSLALSGRPELLKVASVGAMTGAIVLPCAVFLAATVPALIQLGLNHPAMPAIFAIHWFWSLGAASVGPIIGILGLFLLRTLNTIRVW